MASREGFKAYRSKPMLTYLVPWKHDIKKSVYSMSKEQIRNGHPKRGDMIACDHTNPRDTWLVTEKEFQERFTPWR